MKLSDLKPPNWPEIEDHYRAGIRSLKSIGAQFGVAPSSILKHCRKRDIERDLIARVKAEASRRLERVNDGKRTAVKETAVAHADVRRTDDIVESTVSAVVAVQTAHRRDIAKARSIVNSLFAELVEAVEPVVELRGERLERIERDIGAFGVRAALAANLPLRTRVAKDLVETMQRVIILERLTFGLGADSTGDARPVVIVRDFTGRRNEAWTEAVAPGGDE